MTVLWLKQHEVKHLVSALSVLKLQSQKDLHKLKKEPIWINFYIIALILNLRQSNTCTLSDQELL